MNGDLKTYEKIQNVINELYICTEKNEIENVFNKYKINDYSDRIGILQKCMEVEETFYSSNFENIIDEYNTEVEVFIEGSWRLVA